MPAHERGVKALGQGFQVKRLFLEHDPEKWKPVSEKIMLKLFGVKPDANALLDLGALVVG